MAAGIAAGQQEQSHDGRNSHTAARIATWWQGKTGCSKNSHSQCDKELSCMAARIANIQIVEMSSCISACDEQPHNSKSSRMVGGIAAWQEYPLESKAGVVTVWLRLNVWSQYKLQL